MHPAKWFVCTLLVIASIALPARASAQTADIVGRVTDTSGGVLPGATVTVENIGTKDVRTAVTSNTGDYVFTLLPIGTYTVKIDLQGFSAQTSRVVLTSGDRTRVDGKLNIGTVNETVQVSGEAPLLQTDASTLSALVTEKAVQDLPIAGRNFVNVVSMVPGATPTNGAPGGNNNDRRQTSSVSINGGDGTGNNHLIDGMDNNERYIGTIGVKPAIDAIQEIRVQTNLYSAEVGRTGGGVINILTKSGHQRVPWLGVRVLPECSLRRARLLRDDRPDSQPESVRRQPRRPDCLEPHVLLRRLRTAQRDEWPGQQPDDSDAEDAAGRLLGDQRADLRPVHVAARGVPEQPDSGQPDRPDRRALSGPLPGPDHRRAGQQLPEHDRRNSAHQYGGRPHRPSDQREQRALGPLVVQRSRQLQSSRLPGGSGHRDQPWMYRWYE
jgi:hypothetical protein